MKLKLVCCNTLTTLCLFVRLVWKIFWLLKSLFRCFELASGLKVNLHKSNLGGIGVQPTNMDTFFIIMNCTKMSKPKCTKIPKYGYKMIYWILFLISHCCHIISSLKSYFYGTIYPFHKSNFYTRLIIWKINYTILMLLPIYRIFKAWS